MSRLKTIKSHIGEEVGVLGLINGGAAHPFKLAFGGEGNGPVTYSTAIFKSPNGLRLRGLQNSAHLIQTLNTII